MGRCFSDREGVDAATSKETPTSSNVQTYSREVECDGQLSDDASACESDGGYRVSSRRTTRTRYPPTWHSDYNYVCNCAMKSKSSLR